MADVCGRPFLAYLMFPARVGVGLYGDQVEARCVDVGTPKAYHAADQVLAMPTRA